MGHERLRRRAAGDGVQHRRLDLEVALRLHVAANRGDDLEARREDVAHLGVGDEVDVALAVARLGVGQTVVLLRQRTQRLREQRDLSRRDRQLASAGAHDGPDRADPVAEVEFLDCLERVFADEVDAREELQVAGRVSDDEEDDLALVALGDETPGDADDRLGLGARLEVSVARLRAVRRARSRPSGRRRAAGLRRAARRASRDGLRTGHLRRQARGLVSRGIGGHALLVGHRTSG